MYVIRFDNYPIVFPRYETCLIYWTGHRNFSDGLRWSSAISDAVTYDTYAKAKCALNTLVKSFTKDFFRKKLSPCCAYRIFDTSTGLSSSSYRPLDQK